MLDLRGAVCGISGSKSFGCPNNNEKIQQDDTNEWDIEGIMTEKGKENNETEKSDTDKSDTDKTATNPVATEVKRKKNWAKNKLQEKKIRNIAGASR